MYRIYCYCFDKDDNLPSLKMYWNKRLNSWEFNKPIVVKYLEAYWFVVNKYLCNEYKEIVDIDNRYFNYYYYGIEEV